MLSHRSQLLRPLHMWLLGACLPPRCVERPWKKLFSMTKHGQSFARFMARVVFKGPTILVVRGEAGHVFGCYASQSWHKSNKFYGDMTTFVFSVAPVFRIFRASNVNNHFQWLSTRRRARSDFRPEKQHTLGRGGRSKRALRAALPLYAKCWTELLDGGGAQPDVVPQRARRGGGQKDHWGLHLDLGLETGTCRAPCSTCGSFSFPFLCHEALSRSPRVA